MKNENKQFIPFIGIGLLILYTIIAEQLINPQNVMQGCTVQLQWYHVVGPLIPVFICILTLHWIVKYWLDEYEQTKGGTKNDE